MLDAINPPSVRSIALTQDKNGTLSSSNQGTRCFCIHDEKVYILSNELYNFQPAPQLMWTQVPLLPFSKREGQSVTSTPSGLAFFGGKDDNTLYNDLWVFMGEWTYVTADVPARWNQAACCDGQGHLVIYGGEGPKQQVFNDLYVIDISTQETTEIKIPNLPPMKFHSLTAIDEKRIFLFGGHVIRREKQEEIIYETHIIDIQEHTITQIRTDFENNNLHPNRHYSAFIFGMVFIFGVVDKPIWMFNLENNVWIPFRLPKDLVNPAFLFVSEQFSHKQAINIIDDKLDKLADFPIFTNPPTGDISQNPQFIYFLKNQLQGGINYIENLTMLDENMTKLIESRRTILPKLAKVIPGALPSQLFAYQDQLNWSKELNISSTKLKNMISTAEGQLSLSNDQQNSQDQDEIHNIIAQININRKKYKEKISQLDIENENLAKQIREYSFFALNSQLDAANRNSGYPDYWVRLSQKSQQLANEIQFEQSKLEEEKAKKNLKVLIKKSKILNIRDQLWSLSQQEYSLSQQLKAVQTEFYNKISQVLKNRNRELLISSTYENSKKVAELYLKTPTETNGMKALLENLANYRKEIENILRELDPKNTVKCEGSNESKLNSIRTNLDNINDWIEDAKAYLEPGQKSSSRVSSQRMERQRKKTLSMMKSPNITIYIPNEYLTPFTDCIGDPDKFFKDIDLLLKKIEKDVNTIV